MDFLDNLRKARAAARREKKSRGFEPGARERTRVEPVNARRGSAARGYVEHPDDAPLKSTSEK